MKKFVCGMLVAVVLVVAIAFAEGFNFSSMSYDELISLQKAVTAEIMSRPEWKEVKVPAGTWKVGDDIPAGSYGIKTDSYLVSVTVYNNDSKDYSAFESINVVTDTDPLGKITLKDGWVVELTAPVIFTPPVSLGF